MLITDLTFKALLKELVSSVMGNKRAFCPKLQTTPKTPVQPSMSGAGQIVMSVVTTVASTASPKLHPYLSQLQLVQEVPCIMLMLTEVLLKLGIRE